VIWDLPDTSGPAPRKLLPDSRYEPGLLDLAAVLKVPTSPPMVDSSALQPDSGWTAAPGEIQASVVCTGSIVARNCGLESLCPGCGVPRSAQLRHGTLLQSVKHRLTSNTVVISGAERRSGRQLVRGRCPAPTTCGIDSRRKEPLPSGDRSGSAVAVVPKPVLRPGRDNNRTVRFRVSRTPSYTWLSVR
jgi:hypothetical protein